MAQFFASEGYVVLQPNFRGSTGFGLDFRDAGRGQWGLKMQDDVTDGVKAMINTGWTDPERVCIVGWSYGESLIARSPATVTIDGPIHNAERANAAPIRA